MSFPSARRASAALFRLFAVVLALGLAPAARLAAQAIDGVDNTVITADDFDTRATDETIVTIFTGNVSVKGNNMQLTCDRLEVVSLRLDQEKTKVIPREQRFRSLIAEGNVRIIQGARESTCQRAEVLPGEERITLTGRPMVVDHEADVTWLGDELYLLRGERRARGKNVRVILPPVKDLSFDPQQPLDAAPETAAPVPAPAP